MKFVSSQKFVGSSIDGITPPLTAAVLKPNVFWLGRVVANARVSLVFAALFAVLLLRIANVESTISYFTDIEQSLGNFFVADPVYFSVEASTSTPVIVGGDPVVLTMVPGEKSDLVQYQVTASVVGGDPALCSALQLFAPYPFPYDGPAVALSTGFSTQSGPWALSASVPSDNYGLTSGSSCDVLLTYVGWNASSTPGTGYSDTQKVSLTFYLPQAPTPPVLGGGDIGSVEGTSTEATSTPYAPAPNTDASSTPQEDATPPPATDITSPTNDSAVPPVDTPPVGDASSTENTPPADSPAQ